MNTRTAERAADLNGLRALREAIEAFENQVDAICDSMPIGSPRMRVPTILYLVDELTEEGLPEIRMAINDLGYSS